MWWSDDSNKIDHFPEELRAAVRSPRDALRCDDDAVVWNVRDCFRQICLEHLQGTFFIQNSLCKKKDMLEFQQALLAYNLLMENFRGQDGEEKPSRKEIAEMLDSSSLMSHKPFDVLCTLRPVPSSVDYCPTARAARMLSVTVAGYETGFSLGLPFTNYLLQVNYCMRKWIVRRRFSEFIEFQRAVYPEINVLPNILRKDAWFKIVGDRRERGDTICRFLEQMHENLAGRNMYSPRLMNFLEVDVLRIHLEEEGRVAKILDSTGLPSGSVWHPVDECWLKRWRKFVLGRGARRYMPPGKITNLRLVDVQVLEEHKNHAFLGSTYMRSDGTFVRRSLSGKDKVDICRIVPKTNLVLGVDYRSINYNMMRFLVAVHGGGPWISRRDKDIYSRRAIGTVQSVIKLQSFIRMALAHRKFLRHEEKTLSSMFEGVRLVLYEAMEDKIREDAMRQIETSKKTRRDTYLSDAASFTQNMWRSKKQVDLGNTSLAATKQMQELFAEAAGTLETALDSQQLVVEVIKDIVQLPSAEEYTVVFEEGMGFGLALVEQTATKETVVSQARDSARDYVPRHASDKKCNRRRLPEVIPRSVLVAINDCPCSALDHAAVQQRMRKSPFPLRLKMRRPVTAEEITPLEEFNFFESETHNALTPMFDADDVRFQNLKRLLVHGCPLKLHQKKKPLKSMLWMTSTTFSWRSVAWTEDGDVNGLLKRCQLSHLKKRFSQHDPPITREFLQQCNGRVGKGAVVDFETAFEQLGTTSATEDQRLFHEITTWNSAIVTSDFASRAGRQMYDVQFVRAGKKSSGFSSKAKDQHCFTLHFEPGLDKKGKPAKDSLVLEFEVDLPADFQLPEEEGKTEPVPSAGAVLTKADKKKAMSMKKKADAGLQLRRDLLKARMRDELVWALSRIISEIRGTQFYIAQDGTSKRRKEPMRQLRTV